MAISFRSLRQRLYSLDRHSLERHPLERQQLTSWQQPTDRQRRADRRASRRLRNRDLRLTQSELSDAGSNLGSNADWTTPAGRPRRHLRTNPNRMIAPSNRLFVVWIMLMLGMLGLGLNLFRLQVLQGEVLQERAKAQQTILLNASIPRRSIIDREGNVLAIDKPVYTLYVHPILFQQQPETVAVALSPLVHRPLEELLKLFTENDSGIRLAEALPEDAANQIRRLEFDGLELLQQQERLYPQQGLFSNIVGYVNVDRQGQSGVEHSQEEHLARSLPEVQISRSGDGSVIPVGLPQEFAQHDDLQLQLTVDSRMQRATRYALKRQMDKFGAKRGVVIVMDVQDGSILSMASEPSFDANKYYKTDLETLRDWVVADVYEPGSTFKPINLVIALESGAVKPDEVFVDEGAIQIGEWPIQNSDYDSAGARGPLSMTEILEYSSNVGMVRIMQKVNPGVFYGWLERIKLGDLTGIDLPFEIAGQIKTYAQFTAVRIEPATTAFGQGFSMTPLKLIQLHSMIANGGKMVTPHVVAGLVDAKGNLKWQPDRPEAKQVFSPKNTEAVLKMMEKVVQEGTGQPAQIPGYRIAGKTGTAQKASEFGGYSHARITSFIGLLPVEAPRYAVLAVVDEPQGDDAYGSTVTAPIVKEVMEALIASQRIPPTQPEAVGSEEEDKLTRTIRDPIDFRHLVTEPASPSPSPAPGTPVNQPPANSPASTSPVEVADEITATDDFTTPSGPDAESADGSDPVP